MPPKIVMGFDFGTKRMGIAIGQSITKTASPLATIPAQNGIPDWSQIKQLIQKWQPNLCVVGIPYNEEGAQTTQKQAEKFAKQLEKNISLPVMTIDEHLSTVTARDKLRAQNKIPDKTNVNSMAAAVILESWFDQEETK